jgi:hypothetical protein
MHATVVLLREIRQDIIDRSQDWLHAGEQERALGLLEAADIIDDYIPSISVEVES